MVTENTSTKQNDKTITVHKTTNCMTLYKIFFRTYKQKWELKELPFIIKF